MLKEIATDWRLGYPSSIKIGIFFDTQSRTALLALGYFRFPCRVEEEEVDRDLELFLDAPDFRLFTLRLLRRRFTGCLLGLEIERLRLLYTTERRRLLI